MKRRVLNLVTILMVVFMGIGYTSCNDNDDSDDLRSSLIGTWVDYEFFDHNEDGYWFTFREDGTGTYEELGNSYDFTYKVNGNELIITEKSGDEIYHFVISNGKLYLYATDTGELDFILSKSGKGNNNQSNNQSELIQTLMRYKWTGSSTDYDVYSYGAATYTQTWTVYFTSEHEGVMHVRIVDRDSSLGTSRSEEHVDFSYSVEGNKIRLYGGSNFVFTYYGSYMMEGDDVFEPSAMTSSDYTYLREHKEGYHGTEGRIDTEVYIINDDEILKGVSDLEDGWYGYLLQFGFGATSDDAYKKGMTQMKLTVWVDNGCIDTPYKTSNYGKKKTYTLYLSSTKRDWYEWIYVQSKDTKIIFNYELEYYNSKDGKWYDLQSRKLTFYK